MQAAIGALQRPGSVAGPEFKTRECGVTMSENLNRKWDATRFVLWASLFNSRVEASRAPTISLLAFAKV
jgi:hypothetical protein